MVRLPVGEVSALRGWAGLFGRGLADEVRIAVQLHLMQHAARHLDEAREALGADGVDPDEAASRIRARLEERERTAYTRPSTAGLVAREALDEPNLDELGG